MYEVNYGEGFNLRRDVYLRMANMVGEPQDSVKLGFNKASMEINTCCNESQPSPGVFYCFTRHLASYSTF